MRPIAVCILFITVLFLDFCTIKRDPPPELTPPGTRERKSETKQDPGPTSVVPRKEAVPLETTKPDIEAPGIFQTGVASWYGPDFHGKRTANGEIYDMNKLTAAHQHLEFHTLVEVENIDTQEKIVVRINDRGPFVKNRIIDLSKKAATRLGMIQNGTAPVHLRIIKPSDMAKRKKRKKTPPKTPATQNDNITLVPLHKPAVRADGKPGVQVKPDIQSEPVVRDNPVVKTGGKFFLQMGAFSSRKNAERKIRHLIDVMPDSFFLVWVDGGLFKVVTKKFNSRAEAETLKKHFKDNGFDTFIKEESN